MWQSQQRGTTGCRGFLGTQRVKHENANANIGGVVSFVGSLTKDYSVLQWDGVSGCERIHTRSHGDVDAVTTRFV